MLHPLLHLFHCSAGIGRTGVVAGAMELLKPGNNKTPPDIALQLRKTGCSKMVQTEAQFDTLVHLYDNIKSGHLNTSKGMIMGPTQGIQGHQAIQTLNNDCHGSADSNNSSSYVSSSGVKSVLLNAWNAVKSAVSGMLSSFGLHLCGQQGSDKPGRDIVMDMSSRPLPPIPADDDGSDYAQISFDAVPQGSAVLTDKSASEPIYATVNKHSPLSDAEQADINLWDDIQDSGETEAPPVPVYTDRTPLYTQTPENDPQEDSDYADPKELLFNQEQLLQRMMNERLKTL